MRKWDDYKKTMREEDVIYSFARSGDVEALRELNLTNERVNAKNEKGYSALMLAAYHGNLEVARHLLAHGADPNTADLSGSTVLMGAAFKGDLRVVRLLIESGSSVDARNDKNQTALDFAHMFGRAEVARHLKLLQQKPEGFGWTDILSSWGSYFFSRRRRS